MPQASQQITFIRGDKAGAETDYRDALPINMYAVSRPILGADGYMIQDPGLTLHGEGVGVDKGGIWNERQKNHYRVSGGKFISIDENGVETTLGNIGGSDTASLPYSFNTQAIIANKKFFLYDTDNGFRQVTDSNVGEPIDGVWVDGYYFLTDGEFLYHTDLSDESVIDPLAFDVSQFSPDPSLGLGLTQDNKVVVFNRYTTEYFTNVATDNFAFQRVASRGVKIGIVGTHCKCEVNGSWMMLGGRKEEAISVHMLGVGGATKVGTREVDKILGRYSEEDLVDSVLESYEEDGYSFLIVHLPRDVLKLNVTLAADVGFGAAWSVMSSGVVRGNSSAGDSPLYAWRAKHGVFDVRLGKWVYGDKRGANLAILDEFAALQYGDIYGWEVDSPFYYLDEMSIDELEVQTIPGYTVEDDAEILVDITGDGRTFCQPMIQSYGQPNEYKQRFYARRIGYIREFVGFRLRGRSRSRMVVGASAIRYG